MPFVTHGEAKWRAARALDGGAVPKRVKDILAGVLSGSRSKLAEAITLGEL